MKTTLVAIFLLSVLGSVAQAEATAVANSSQRYELIFAPAVSYSSYAGIGLGGTVGLGTFFFGQWQAVTEIDHLAHTKSGEYSSAWRAGVQYNFSPDLSNSWFAGLGAASEYGFHIPVLIDGAYVRLGYRRNISKEFQVSWNPGIEVRAFGNRDYAQPRLYIGIKILEFSILF